MITSFYYDYYACFGKPWSKQEIRQLFKTKELRYTFYGRMALEASSPVIRFFFRLLRHHLSGRLGISLPFDHIGKGFMLYHGAAIAINDSAILGDYVSIRNGVTIGAENRGPRKGAPTIGNRVWIGSNAVIVGNITIGNDVLIAPNAYVNFSVPDHSIVIGNPAVIKHRDWATRDYIAYFTDADALAK